MARVAQKEAYLVESMQPYLQQFANQIRHSVNLAVLQDDRVLYLDCVLPTLPVDTYYNSPGYVVPAHATALGKVLLANLPPDERNVILQRLELRAYTGSTITELPELLRAVEEIRQQGYALDHGEYNPDSRCISVALKDVTGAARAALSVTLRVREWSKERELEIISQITAVAEHASQALLTDVR